MAAAALPAGLIDTDILIDAERNVALAVNFLADQQATGAVRMSSVSAMELMTGCRNQHELKLVTQSLSRAVILELSQQSSRQARDWIEKFSLSHGLQLADALIAATALEHALPLYTKNVKHFQMLPGLTVVRPY